MGRRTHALLLGHMQRYCYSAMGALRWKRDVTEYADVLRASHSPATNAQVHRRGSAAAHPRPACLRGTLQSSTSPVACQAAPAMSAAALHIRHDHASVPEDDQSSWKRATGGLAPCVGAESRQSLIRRKARMH